MENCVRFLVFAHGHIIEGSYGPEYDRPPVKKVKIRIGSSFEQFVNVKCRAAGIDPNVN